MNVSLIELQYFQDMHDRRYHADIYGLPLMRRMAHLHNHMVKYSANKVRRLDSHCDAIACLLSMANALNISLSAVLSKWSGEFVTDMTEVPLMYRTDRLESQLSNVLGQMAKIIEGHDHTESIDYRDDLREAVIELFIVYSGIRVELDQHFWATTQTEYIQRMFDLKSKHIFYGFFTELDTQDKVYLSFFRMWQAAQQ